MILESPESSSPIVTRAVAAGLRGDFHKTYGIQGWQRPVLRLLGYFPQDIARYTISQFQALSGINPLQLVGLKIDDVIHGRLHDYQSVNGKFDTLTIGPALGGACAHLSLAMRSPFLPIAFVFTLRGGSGDSDATTYYQRSADLALRIASDNPEVFTIQHFDPIHDGWLTRHVNHLRIKLVSLPGAYRKYILDHLNPGGSICYLDCGAKWLRFKVGERSYFQVGGWGNIPPQEFLYGSPRINQYKQSLHISNNNWSLRDIEPEPGPESEWGSEPALAAVLEQFCDQYGFHFVRIGLSEPHDYSRLAFRAVARQLQKDGRQPAGVFVEMFSQFDATAVIKSGLLPLWLVFNTWDCLAFLKTMVDEFPRDKPIFFSPLATFSLTPDIVPWEEWQNVFQDFRWQNIGTRPSHYPADVWTLLDWEKLLWQWVDQNSSPIRYILSADEMLSLSL